MDQEAQRFLEDLNNLLEEEGVDARLEEGFGEPQRGGTLRVALPISLKGSKGLTDIAWSSFSPEWDLLHIHVNLIPDTGRRAFALLDAIASWNKSCPIGFFLINSEGSLAYRYTFPFPKTMSGETLAREVLKLLKIISDLLSQYSTAAAQIMWPEAANET